MNAYLAMIVIATSQAAASIDLTTDAGVALVRGQWRYSDAKIVDVPFRAPDADGQPTGAPVVTYDIAPQAGGADFDDSAWQVLAPASLKARRGNGRVSFNWYPSELATSIPQARPYGSRRVSTTTPRSGSTARSAAATDSPAGR